MIQRKAIPITEEQRILIDGNVKEWREPGTRNYIRVADKVKVKPSTPGKHDGFEARVTGIYDDGIQVVFRVVGGTRGRQHTRFIRSDRVARVAQTKSGMKKETR